MGAPNHARTVPFQVPFARLMRANPLIYIGSKFSRSSENGS